MTHATLTPPQNATAVRPDWPLAQVRRPGDFPPEMFTLIPRVPVFTEHETVTKKGRVLKFGPRELELIVNRCNRRIQETGDYAMLTIGHTPSPEQRAAGAKLPEVVGYAGPFYMGLLQQPDQRPRAVVLADWHVFNEDVQRLKKLPRRSAELWIEDRYEDMFLDPIALLGYEPPRLDQGLLYSARLHRGTITCEIERYTAVAPAAANCFIPSADWRAGDPRRYAATTTEEGDYMPMSPEDLQAIVGAIQELPVMQWAKAKMEAETSPAATAGTEGTEPPAPEPAPVPETQPNMAGSGAPVAPTVPPASAPAIPQAPEPKPEVKPNMAGANIKRFMADDGECIDVDAGGAIVKREHTKLPDAPSEEPTKYSLLEHKIGSLTGEVQTLRQELTTERGARVDAQRLNVLQQLAYAGYQIEPRKHMERMCYSKMTAAQFDDQISLIKELGARAPLNTDLPGLDEAPYDPNANGDSREKYSKEHSDRARQICEQAAIHGKEVDYATVLNQIRRGEAVNV